MSLCSSVLVLHLVRGLLFLGQSVAGGKTRGQPSASGRRRGTGGHHLLLLLHLHLGLYLLWLNTRTLSRSRVDYFSRVHVCFREALRCSLWRDLSVCVLKRSMRSSLHTRINMFPVRVEPQLSSWRMNSSQKLNKESLYSELTFTCWCSMQLRSLRLLWFKVFLAVRTWGRVQICCNALIQERTAALHINKFVSVMNNLTFNFQNIAYFQVKHDNQLIEIM